MTGRVPAITGTSDTIGRFAPGALMFLAWILFYAACGIQPACAEEITLQWDPSPSKKVKGYKVHTRAEGGGFYVVENVGKVTKHAVRDLSRNEQYVFTVTAYDATGRESIQSNAVRWGSPLSETTPSPASGGCLIAAVAYGTPDDRDVVVLRKFRDRYLEPNTPGRWVIGAYERISPPLVDLIRGKETVRGLVRGAVGLLAYILTHPGQSAATFIVLVAGVTIGLHWHGRRRRARSHSEGSAE